MTTEALLNYAEQRGHDVISYPTESCPSFTVQDEQQRCHIAISNRATQQETKVYLAHELGHCEYAGLYTRYSPYVLRSRCEHRADKWAFLRLCPPGRVRQAVAAGCETPWMLAEYFDVPLSFMQACLRYYDAINALPAAARED